MQNFTDSLSENVQSQMSVLLNKNNTISKTLLVRFEPIARLSSKRLIELAPLCVLEQVSKDLDPTRMAASSQSLYLAKGDLGIRYENGKKVILRANTDAAKHPVDTGRLKIKDTIALTPIEIVRIDLDLLDIMMTWDQLSGNAHKLATSSESMCIAKQGWQIDSVSFDAFQLHNGVFNKLPPANIQEMFARLTPVEVKANQVIITQGQEGDYFYLIQQGEAIVSRLNSSDHANIQLANISVGASFGEDALASDNKRNATVTMKTDGLLLRLKKDDFIELLKAPIVNMINYSDAQAKVIAGAVWLDVRFLSEYKHAHIDGAINTPLHELRSHAAMLDKSINYIVYCQTGRRSSAAAFILAQCGLNAQVLEGGTRAFI